METGLGGFYDGIAHVALTPSDLLIAIGMALLAGQRGAPAARAAVHALAVAWLLGGLLGARWPGLSGLSLATTLSFFCLGLLVALDAKVPRAGLIALAIGAGLLHGVANGATLSPAGAGLLALTGAVCAVLYLGIVLSAEVAALPRGWPLIAVRVAGSWIAATGLLMLGWLARPTP